MPHITAFARNQWYVAAYSHEVGREELLGRTILGRAPRLLPHRGRRDARRTRRPLCAPPVPAVTRSPAGSTATASCAGTTGSPTTRPAPACTCPARSASRAPPVSPPTPWSSRTRWSGCGSATRRSRTRRPSRGRDTSPPPAGSPSAAWSPSTPTTGCSSTTSSTCPTRRICTAVTSAPPRSPRRRSPPRSTRARASCGSAGTWTTPNARRSTPSPPGSRAGSRAGRTSSTTRRACICCTAASRRSAWCRRRTAATRTASTPRSRTPSRRPPTARCTTSGWSRATGRPDDAEVTEFLRGNNHTVVMQDVDALNLLQKTLGTERTGYQELSINIDTGGLAARRILARPGRGGRQARGDGPVSSVRPARSTASTGCRAPTSCTAPVTAAREHTAQDPIEMWEWMLAHPERTRPSPTGPRPQGSSS